MLWQFKKHFNTHYFIWSIKELCVNYHFGFTDKEIDFRESTLVNIAKNLISLSFLQLLSIPFYNTAARVVFLLLKILWRLPIFYIFLSTMWWFMSSLLLFLAMFNSRCRCGGQRRAIYLLFSSCSSFVRGTRDTSEAP